MIWAVASVIALTLALWPALGAGARTATVLPAAEREDTGRQLYVTGCSSCHGLDGRGTDRGPTLERAGEASAYYYLSTGRMPHSSEGQPTRKPSPFSDEQIELLTEYVGTLGDGPPLPEVDEARGNLAEGGVLFRAECAACHSAAGIGGALSYGGYAPPLTESEAKQIAAAVRAGPGNMPHFGPEVFDDEEVDSLVRYVEFLKNAPTPGGARLGGAGPLPEGAVGWVFGVGALLAATVWIGRKRAKGGHA